MTPKFKVELSGSGVPAVTWNDLQAPKRKNPSRRLRRSAGRISRKSFDSRTVRIANARTTIALALV
jgi:hypothetical protein